MDFVDCCRLVTAKNVLKARHSENAGDIDPIAMAVEGLADLIGFHRWNFISAMAPRSRCDAIRRSSSGEIKKGKNRRS
jgi:hypothetical protein